jgi:hypothetical protein
MISSLARHATVFRANHQPIVGKKFCLHLAMNDLTLVPVGRLTEIAPLSGAAVVLRDLVVSQSGDSAGFIDRVLGEQGRSRRVALTVPNAGDGRRAQGCDDGPWSGMDP